jgi:hypothetical protein
METTPAPVGDGVGEIVVLPDHCNFPGCPVFEPNGPSAAAPDERFRDNIPDPTERLGP